jgi:glycosyltransferase involved in cell wall biosynthesis
MLSVPPIGVVIPARNAAPWLATALRSLLAQTRAEWRAVVVDDGSTDATAAVASGFADPRIGLRRQAPAGVSAARNHGIAALAGSTALLFLDADDALAPDALARLDAGLRAAPRAVAASGPYVMVRADDPSDDNPSDNGPPDDGAPDHARAEDGAVLSAARRAGRVKPGIGGDVLARLLTRNRFANGGHLLIRAEAVARAGGFRPELRYGEDWEYWVRLAALGPFVAAPGRRPVLFVRRRAAGAFLAAAADPAAFAPALAAAFTAPAVLARFEPGRLARLRRRMEAETAWVAGRALLWHGRRAEALGGLRRAWLARPSLRRAALLGLWHLGGPA